MRSEEIFKKRGIALAMVALSLVIGVHTLVAGDHLSVSAWESQSSADAVVSRALGQGYKTLVLWEASGVFFVIDEVVH